MLIDVHAQLYNPRGMKNLGLIQFVAPHTAGFLRLVLILALSCILCLPQHAAASELPFSRKATVFSAENTPLVNFLLDLLSSQGVPGVVSESVGAMTAKVNGKFRQAPGTVLDELCRQYGLVWYYDGTAVFISRANESASSMAYVDRGDFRRVVQFARELGIADPRFTLRGSDTEASIFIAGPRRYVERMNEIIEFVAASPLKQARNLEFKVFKLKYARAADSSISMGGSSLPVPGLATIISRVVSRTGPEDTVKIGGAPLNSSKRLDGLSGKGLASRTTENSQEKAANAEKFSFAKQDRAEPRGNNGEMTANRRDSVGQQASGAVLITAEPRMNAIIVYDNPIRFSLYQSLIDVLDIPTALLDIEATIVDIDSSKLEELGTELRLHGGSKFDSLSAPGASGGGLGYTNNPFSTAPGVFSLTALAGNAQQYLMMRITALAQEGSAKVISRPRVVTMENQAAVLSNTEEFYVPVAGRDSADLFNVNVGLSFQVTPSLVGEPGKPAVKLFVQIADGSSTAQFVGNIPLVKRSQVAMEGMVMPGQSLVIGGYAVEESGKSTEKVPVLGDIPVLGALFKKRNDRTRRTERVFIITPRVLDIERIAESQRALPGPAVSSINEYVAPASSMPVQNVQKTPVKTSSCPQLPDYPFEACP